MRSKLPEVIAVATKIAAVALSVAGIVACQGSTGGSTAPPSSGTVAMNGPESPAAGPPAVTQQPAQTADPAAGAGSAPAPSGSADPSKGVAANTPGAVTVAQATAMAPGAKAMVRGLYLGWRGPCLGAPPTRSAWQLADRDEKGAPCLYVDGPVPPGLDPAGRGAPTWVRVDGELIASGPNHFLASHKADKEIP